jgi:hypothetical protein
LFAWRCSGKARPTTAPRADSARSIAPANPPGDDRQGKRRARARQYRGAAPPPKPAKPYCRNPGGCMAALVRLLGRSVSVVFCPAGTGRPRRTKK